MFGIGGTELLLILLVALLVLGPKSIPQIARTLGKALREFRQVSSDFQHTLNTEITFDEHEKRVKEGYNTDIVKNNVGNNEVTKADISSTTDDVISDTALSSSPPPDNNNVNNTSSDKEQVEKASI